MKASLLLSFIFIIGICSWSCRDPIDLTLRAEQLSGISIQSQLIKGNPSFVNADIQRIFTFSAESRKVLPITSVELEDDLGNTVSLARAGVGFWRLTIPNNHPSFKVDFDRQYRINAIVEEKNYVSDFESLHPVPKMESLSFEIFQQNVVNSIGELTPGDFARFSVDTPVKLEEREEKSRLKWNVWQLIPPTNPLGIPTSGCVSFRSPDFSHLEILDGNNIAADNVQGLPIFEPFINFSFPNTYYLFVEQESLSQNAFDYWSEVKINTVREGTQFEPEIGNISSNFKNVDDDSERVFGYFYASEKDFMIIKACAETETFEVSPRPESFCNFNPFEGFWKTCP